MRIPGFLAVVVATLAAPVGAGAQARTIPNEQPTSGFIGGYYGRGVSGFQLAGSDSIGPSLVGASVGLLGHGPVMGELDVMHASSFFGARDSLGSNHLTTLTGNLIAWPLARTGGLWRRLRPFAVAGAGVMLSRIEAFGALGTDRNARGVVNAGGGLTWLVTRRIGVRGEYRYFAGVGKVGDDWGTIDAWTFSRVTAALVWAW